MKVCLFFLCFLQKYDTHIEKCRIFAVSKKRKFMKQYFYMLHKCISW